jgi:hypothetical protein
LTFADLFIGIWSFPSGGLLANQSRWVIENFKKAFASKFPHDAIFRYVIG